MQFMLQKYYFFLNYARKILKKCARWENARARWEWETIVTGVLFSPNAFLYTLPTPAIAFVHLAYQGHEGLSTSRDLSLDAPRVYLPTDESRTPSPFAPIF